MTLRTRTQVEAWCRERKIALTAGRSGHSGIWHVHVDIDAPRSIFRAHELHNLGLWDSEQAPDWRAIGADLEAADFGPCTIEGCEYCEEDE